MLRVRRAAVHACAVSAATAAAVACALIVLPLELSDRQAADTLVSLSPQLSTQQAIRPSRVSSPPDEAIRAAHAPLVVVPDPLGQEDWRGGQCPVGGWAANPVNQKLPGGRAKQEAVSDQMVSVARADAAPALRQVVASRTGALVVRIAAVTSLAQSDETGVTEFLMDLAADESEHEALRTAAIDGLAGRADGSGALLQVEAVLITSSSDLVKRMCASYLARRGNRGSAQLMAAMAGLTTPHVRRDYDDARAAILSRTSGSQ